MWKYNIKAVAQSFGQIFLASPEAAPPDFVQIPQKQPQSNIRRETVDDSQSDSNEELSSDQGDGNVIDSHAPIPTRILRNNETTTVRDQDMGRRRDGRHERVKPDHQSDAE